jgi:TRAP-type C4-dicarboxylate transport system substrate-binding protein
LKKLILVLIIALVAITGSALTLTACSGGTTTVTVTATGPGGGGATSTPAPASYDFIYTDHSPPTAAGVLLWDNEYIPYFKSLLPAAMAAKTNFTNYHASSLYPYSEQVNAVQQGLADITLWSNSFEVERAPLTDVMDLPFMGWRSSGESTAVWDAMEATDPNIAAEWSKFIVLGRWNGLKRAFASKDDKSLPSDFNGSKVIASGVIGNIFKSIGAAALQQAPADWYTSLNTGLADTLVTGPSMLPMLQLADVTHYVYTFTTGDLGYVGTTFIMNKDRFYSLPAEMQNAFMKLRPWLTQRMVDNDAKETANGLKYAHDSGMVVKSFTPEQEQLWFQAAAPIQKQWIADGSKYGIDRQKVFDEAKYWIHVYETGATP